jgi:very-short-patch-repair endonuclease
VPTQSDARLWEALRGGKLRVQFRRQVPLAGRFIVDFLAPAARLVVEVDGGYHSRRARADECRDRDLQRLGYTVIRLPVALVINELSRALAQIVGALRLRSVPWRLRPP